MCSPDQSAGPAVDVEFFAELDKLFDKYPDARTKYSIGTLPLKAAKLGVDLETHVAVSRYDAKGRRIITEFQPRDPDLARRAHHACCEWFGGSCAQICWE